MTEANLISCHLQNQCNFFFVDKNVAALSFMGDRGGRSCSCVSFNDRTLRHHFTTSTLGIYLQVYTFKSIISSIGVILFIEVSKRTLMSLWWHTSIPQGYGNKASTVLNLCASLCFYALFLKVFWHDFFVGFSLFGVFFKSFLMLSLQTCKIIDFFSFLINNLLR